MVKDEALEAKALVAYPVPLHDYLNLEFNLQKDSDDVDIKIYDMSGVLLKTVSKQHLTAGSQLMTIDVSTVARHQLLAVVVSASDWSKVLKVIKN